jgi:hypothetical protein
MGDEFSNVFSFIHTLKKYQMLNETKIVQALAGHPPPAQRQQYNDITAAISNILLDYDRRTKVQILRGIAHVLSYDTN